MADITAAQALELVADTVYLKRRAPPVAPTGYYDWQITTDPADDREGHALVSNLVSAAETAKSKGVYKPNPRDVDAFLDAIVHPTAIDDRKGAFATGLGILARLDPNSDLEKTLNNTVIDTLYNTVPHPPASFLGPNHCYRHADGGGNNLQNPDYGRGGTSYARSVQGKAGLPYSSLPDAGLIFDTILQRKGIVNHSGGMSSLIFAFASIVTHSLFRTDTKDMSINNASSYLDLSPLYGDNQAAQDKVRDKASGRGLLFPDTFSEERLLFLPPATSVLLVLFSRNHNYIANKLLKINERKLWSDPPPTDAAQRALQDEQIFQTARLVNGGHFINAIMGDYVAGFLGSSEGLNWNMNAFDASIILLINTKDLKVERGLGNHVSVEFNVLYRWHATMSARDQKWTEDVFSSVIGDKPIAELGLNDVATIARVFDTVAPNPAERTFAGLTRGSDGRFSDDDLADILQTATETPAGAFRGRGTPEVLRLVEIMGIEQSRAWGVCTMNEFRKFLGLKPEFETFEEWNPDPEIATGLQAESTMPLTDGSRFACGYTTTRGVLGDAIALVRGDRFYTSDFTPLNLTTWGFYDCQRDMNNGGQGGIIPKLIIRHLPRHFPWNSVYSLYPFFTPEKMQDSLNKQGIASKYTFDHPPTLPVPKILNTFTAIKTVWNDPARFKVVYEKFGYGSPLMFDDPKQHDGDKAMVLHALFPEKESLNQHGAWVSAAIKAKVLERTWKYKNVPGNYVDIVKDVVNPVAAHFTAEKLTGISIKTKDNPSGILTENELFDMLATLPENSFSLHEAATIAGTKIGAFAAKSVIEVIPSSSPNVLGKISSAVTSLVWSPKSQPWYPFLSRLAATGRPLDEILGNILGVAVGASVNWAHGAVNVIDFYLDDARATERKHIIELVNTTGPENEDLLRGYIREGMRLKPQYAGLWRKAVVDAVLDQGPGLPPLEVKAGDWIRGSFRNAHLDPSEFPDPTKVNPSRPTAAYNYLNGTGFHNCPGVAYSVLTITEIVKTVFRLKNVRRAPGNAGILRGFTEIVHETKSDFFIQRNGTVSAWPGSLYITYDE
ncbi:hypothetical protein DXG01_012306 [Tephrocybe rancida]|nr:hypothetical protein DXG01_012306 [Tephrocybe rancida]